VDEEEKARKERQQRDAAARRDAAADFLQRKTEEDLHAKQDGQPRESAAAARARRAGFNSPEEFEFWQSLSDEERSTIKVEGGKAWKKFLFFFRSGISPVEREAFSQPSLVDKRKCILQKLLEEWCKSSSSNGDCRERKQGESLRDVVAEKIAKKKEMWSQRGF